MLKKTITYETYNGEEVTEDFYFNLTEAELVQLEASHDGGLHNHLTKIVEELDQKEIIKAFKEIIDISYGVKSDDGKRFIKNDEVLQDFKYSPAYSILFMELGTNAEAATEFVNGILPKDLASKLDE